MKSLSALLFGIIASSGALSAAQAEAPAEPKPALRITSAAQAARIPLEIWEGMTFVRVRAGAAAPAWFVFDTGATINVIDLAFAKAAGLDLSDRQKSPRTGQETVRTHGATFSFAGIELTGQSAVAMDLGELSRFSGRAISGIFGFELLRHAVVEVDYAASTMAVVEPAGYDASRHGAETPLSVLNHWPVVPVRVDQPGMPPLENRIILDSGSLAPLSLMTGGPARETIELPANAGIGGVGRGKNRVGRVAGLAFGGRALKDVPAIFPPAGAPEPPDYLKTAIATTGIGLIGAPILSRFFIVYNYPKGTLQLETRPGWDAPLDWDRSGMVVMTADASFKTFQVLGVAPGTPAAEAGLAPGDVIASIDGRPAGETTLPQFRKMLKNDGATVTLGIVRGEESKTVVLKLRKLI